MHVVRLHGIILPDIWSKITSCPVAQLELWGNVVHRDCEATVVAIGGSSYYGSVCSSYAFGDCLLFSPLLRVWIKSANHYQVIVLLVDDALYRSFFFVSNLEGPFLESLKLGPTYVLAIWIRLVRNRGGDLATVSQALVENTFDGFLCWW